MTVYPAMYQLLINVILNNNSEWRPFTSSHGTDYRSSATCLDTNDVWWPHTTSSWMRSSATTTSSSSARRKTSGLMRTRRQTSWDACVRSSIWGRPSGWTQLRRCLDREGSSTIPSVITTINQLTLLCHSAITIQYYDKPTESRDSRSHIWFSSRQSTSTWESSCFLITMTSMMELCIVLQWNKYYKT